MNKYFLRIIVILAILVLTGVCVNFFYFGKSYKIENIDISIESNINLIKQTFFDFQLPEGAKIINASKVTGGSASLYVKVIIPAEKINEFNNDFSLETHIPITGNSLEVNKMVYGKMFKWWKVDESNADYYISVYHTGKQFIYCKPENGVIAVYMIG